MNGYLINKGPMWVHAMKRAIGPGAKVPLSELYDQYGPKHDIKKGKEFVEWLKSVKLRGSENWHVEFGKKTKKEEKVKEEKVKKEVIEIKEGRVDISKINPKSIEISDVVNLSVRQAREVVPHITDLNTLKYALSEAGPRSGKDSLCRILRKRIMEMEITRR